MTGFKRIIPHDKKDIGWKVERKLTLLHYYRSTAQSNLAMAHCALLAGKDDLITGHWLARCQYCSMVEDLRDEMDGKNEKPIS